jgi:uncharacterized protein (DUF1501 family)
LDENGVRFFQAYGMPDKDGWDAHERLDKNHTPRFRWTDQPRVALIQGLKHSELIDSTLVVCDTECGRTPCSQGSLGRDHNCGSCVSWLRGADIRGAVMYGASDEIGYQAALDVSTGYDLHTTILHQLGIDHVRLLLRTDGADR